jgi:hypothetical protein
MNQIFKSTPGAFWHLRVWIVWSLEPGIWGLKRVHCDVSLSIV